ncbi:MAG: DUF4231 domain-containing protein [Mucilaginibacter sp.]|uniref:DUF4231 domain-containing protein n=1 Tax=Mucilaginibacter sp. TaxID=1882438 RepID=UPI003265DA99
MDKAAFDDYVANRYQDQLNYYEATSGRNQKKYKRFQWILIVLTALTPVFAALKTIKWGDFVVPIDLSVLVLVTSTIVAILTTGLKTFNYQELWIKSRTTYEMLKPELYYYNFNVGDYIKDEIDKESVFVTRVEAILGSEHREWPVKSLQDKDKPAKEETIAKP